MQINIVDLFFIIFIFNLIIFISYIYYFFQKFIFHNNLGSKLKLKMKEEVKNY